MAFPKLTARNTSREFIDVFNGYVHKLKIKDGEFYETKNLSDYKYPLFSTRPLRGVGGAIAVDEYDETLTYSANDYVTHEGKLWRCTEVYGIETPEAWNAAHWTEANDQMFGEPVEVITAKDALYWIGGNRLYRNGRLFWDEQFENDVEHMIVNMGAYICIFPEKKYINTLDPSDCGDMEAEYGGGTASEANLRIRACHQDGTVYSNATYSDTEPASPSNGDLWVDTARGKAQEYSSASASWVTLDTVYTRIGFTDTYGHIPELFKEYDGVTITGLPGDLSGEKIIYALGGHEAGSGQTAENDWIVLVGMPHPEHTYTTNLSIKRTVPDMDYMCEAQNRLWGCKYGLVDGKNVNEIFCSALGDFKNWNQYLGIATDSWRASRGSDGEWTGCINYLGTPTFFKENMIHPVSVSSAGAHQVTDIPARGVQKGSWKSLAVVGETLYYKSRPGVMAYQGGMPADISDALGGEKYYNAVGGVFDERYYISMQDKSDDWHLFCYDAARGIWMHEDDLHAIYFATLGDELYAQTENKIIALNGTVGRLEEPIEWQADTGILPYRYPDKKYVYRYDLSMYMEEHAKVKLYIEYDSSGTWTFMGDVELGSQEITGSKVIPVRPRRCDHLRIRLIGKGDVKIYSITRILEKGSDV